MDAFAGIVLGLQRPFRVGDWIQAEASAALGRVAAMTWRAVTVVTADGITYVVPNGQLINNLIKGYTRPQPFFRDEIRLTLPYSVTTHQAQRILLGAAGQVEEDPPIARTPAVTILDYTDRGVLWSLLYWCS